MYEAAGGWGWGGGVEGVEGILLFGELLVAYFLYLLQSVLKEIRTRRTFWEKYLKTTSVEQCLPTPISYSTLLFCLVRFKVVTHSLATDLNKLRKIHIFYAKFQRKPKIVFFCVTIYQYIFLEPQIFWLLWKMILRYNINLHKSIKNSLKKLCFPW